MQPKNNNFEAIVAFAIAEDVGEGDVTAKLIAAETLSHGIVMTRELMVLAGQNYFNEVFRQIDDSISITWKFNDAALINANNIICEVNGNARNILTAERTALNFLQTLSATATATHRMTELIKHTHAKLLDTRKTIPGLRSAQKYAVKCGGGYNHRMGLYDAYLIKENHIMAAGSITEAVRQAKALNSSLLLEVEVENLKQLDEALSNHVSRILLDNFNLNQIKEAVVLTNKRAELEVSGNVTEKNIVAIAETGVDYISAGQITKNIKAIDLSLKIA